MGLDIKGNVVTGYWFPHYGESRMQNEFNFKIVTIRKGSLREITDGVKPEAAKGAKKEEAKKEKKKKEDSHYKITHDGRRGNVYDKRKKGNGPDDGGIHAYNEFVENMLETGNSWEEAEEDMPW